MKNDTVVRYENPAQAVASDNLTQFIRENAQKMLKVAIEAEVNEFLSEHKTTTLPDGRQRVVRNGHLPERAIQTGVGPVNVSVPRVRDRSDVDDKLRFISNLIPKYMRRTATLDVMLPLLYLKGISTGDMPSVMAPLLGTQTSAVSDKVVRTLKASWLTDFEAFQKRDLSMKRYVYWWVDGINISARLESDKNCLLVIIGADKDGNKELVAVSDGFRESTESWYSLILQLQQQGLPQGPHVAIGDGALGFWRALSDVYPATAHQRCWVHKTANVLDKLPKSVQGRAKSMLHDIYLAETKQTALVAYDRFIEQFQLKYPKVITCLEKGKDDLFTFYAYPAEHWVHLRTTNPIESTFATVRHRTRKSKNCLSRKTALACVFKLCLEAQKRWKKLNGAKRMADVINLVEFKDGLPVNKTEKKNSFSCDDDNKIMAA